MHVPTTKAGWVFRSLLFVLGFIIIPILLLTAPLVAGILLGGYLGIECLKAVAKINVCCCKFFLFISGIPLLFLLIALGFALGGAAGGVALPILLIPAYAFHLYVFCRILHWWNRSRIKN